MTEFVNLLAGFLLIIEGARSYIIGDLIGNEVVEFIRSLLYTFIGVAVIVLYFRGVV